MYCHIIFLALTLVAPSFENPLEGSSAIGSKSKEISSGVKDSSVLGSLNEESSATYQPQTGKKIVKRDLSVGEKCLRNKICRSRMIKDLVRKTKLWISTRTPEQVIDLKKFVDSLKISDRLKSKMKKILPSDEQN